MLYAYKAVASALNTLLGQLNALAPKRSKLSDGALGDQAHAARVSFHNPNPSGVVQARDFTHDPAGGLDCNWLAAALIASGDKRIHEIIWNRRYWTPAGGWVPYTGSNPHDKHLHVTVRSDPKLYNSTALWDLTGPRAPAPAPTPIEEPDVLDADQNNRLTEAMIAARSAHADASNAASIASEVRNWILDPNHGVLKQLGTIAGQQAATIELLSKLDGGDGLDAAEVKAAAEAGAESALRELGDKLASFSDPAA